RGRGGGWAFGDSARTALGGGGGDDGSGGGCTPRMVRACASSAPSSVTRLMLSSARPVTPEGTLICRVGSAWIGTDHAPGAVTYPSESYTVGGRPRTRRELFFCRASGGPILMARGTREAGPAAMVGATVICTDSAPPACTRCICRD